MADTSNRAYSGSDKSTNVLSISYYFEHYAAWLFAAGAIAMGAIGLLVGFGRINGTTTVAGTTVTTPASAFWNGSLWLSTAIAAAVLAYALHRTEHHFHRDPAEIEGPERGLWMFEHYLAWLIGLGAIALGVIGLIIGFDVPSRGYTIFDGLLWSFSAAGASVLTSVLHNVSHHQLAAEEDYIVGVVERRVGAGMPGMAATPTRPYPASGADRP